MALAKKICIKAAAGGQHSLVLTDANKIYAWGNNNFGQLGMGISKSKYMCTCVRVPSVPRHRLTYEALIYTLKCVYTHMHRHTEAYTCTHTPADDEYLARPDIVSSMRL
jgi:alpha-tubulin suppressor-like RCC1 family protein